MTRARSSFYDWKSSDIGNGHIFWILTKDLEERIALQKISEKTKYSYVFHYVPLHSSPAGKKFGRPHGKLEITDSVYAKLLRLPLQAFMSDADIDATCEAIFDFWQGKYKLMKDFRTTFKAIENALDFYY